MTEGFTIIEVLIVIAVSGLLVASALTLLSGRQGQTAFDQGINEVNSEIEQDISNVENGYYNAPDTLDCQYNTGVAPNYQINLNGTRGRGQNPTCVFLGTALDFNISPSSYTTYTVVDGQPANNPQSTGLYCDACTISPIVIAGSLYTYPGAPDESVNVPLQDSLSLTQMYYNNSNTSSNQTEGAIISYNSQGNYSGGSLGSGSHQLWLYPLVANPPGPGGGPPPVPTPISAGLDGSPIQTVNDSLIFFSQEDPTPVNNIEFCLTDGTRYGKITIEGGSGQLTTSLTEGTASIC